MTTIDRARAGAGRAPDADDPVDQGPTPRWWRSPAVGLATGVVSLLLVLGPALYAWSAGARAIGTAMDAAGVGSALWLLSGGAPLLADGATVSVVPLLGLAILIVVARLGAREAMVEVSTDGDHVLGIVPRPLAGALLGWWAGYLVPVGAAVAMAWSGPLRPTALGLLGPAVGIPLAGVGWALRRVGRDDPDVLGPALAVRGIPDAVRRGIRPGLAGALRLVGLGVVVVLAAVIVDRDRVLAVHAALETGGAGSAVLIIAQLAALPNVATWAVSFLAGPGFQVVDGGAVTWAGAESGLLPMVPVFAALPQPGRFPWFIAPLSVAVVVLIGAWIGRRALDAVARLSRLRTKLVVVVAACATSAVTLGLLDTVGGGSVGQFRLADLGAPGARLVAFLFVELVAGALVVVLRDAWRLRR
jgi:hypothetical protein